MSLIVTVRPYRTAKEQYSPKFEARLGDRLLCVSITPLLDSARILLAEGVDPATPIAMRHEGADHDALTATVGVAAMLTAAERDQDRPRFEPWKGRQNAAVPPSARFPASPLSDIGSGSDAPTAQAAAIRPRVS
jgi:hypothetical protein